MITADTNSSFFPTRLTIPCIFMLQMFTATRPDSETNARLAKSGYAIATSFRPPTEAKHPYCKKSANLGRYAIARTLFCPSNTTRILQSPHPQQNPNPEITEKNPDLRGQKGTSEDSDGLWGTSPMRLIRNQQVTSSSLVIGSIVSLGITTTYE